MSGRLRSRLRAIVHGDVQGVGFRYFVLRRAEAAGLTGWVRNRPDGSVECLAEGPRPELEALLAELRRGPRMSSVERVEAEWEPARGDVRGFGVA